MVRDKIPLIAEGCYVKCYNKENITLLLAKKLVEESIEFLVSFDENELADVLEVIHALSKVLGLDLDELRRKKNASRGGLSEFWVMVECP